MGPVRDIAPSLSQNPLWLRFSTRVRYINVSPHFRPTELVEYAVPCAFCHLSGCTIISSRRIIKIQCPFNLMIWAKKLPGIASAVEFSLHKRLYLSFSKVQFPQFHFPDRDHYRVWVFEIIVPVPSLPFGQWGGDHSLPPSIEFLHSRTDSLIFPSFFPRILRKRTHSRSLREGSPREMKRSTKVEPLGRGCLFTLG